MQNEQRLTQNASQEVLASSRPSAFCLLPSAFVGVCAGVLALGLYARTLAPGLTWAHNGADGGDLLAAVLTGGVPHPTGYPTYQLLLAAALAVFRGEPARIGNGFSAVCAAIAVALLTDLARRMLPDRPWCNIAGLGAGLAWATAPGLWGQAVITEVYTLNAAAVAALLWLMWRGQTTLAASGRGWPWLTAAGLIFGLGLGNHLTLALMLPAFALWLWPLRNTLRNRPWWTQLAPLAAFALGLSVYAYLPWAAAHHPPVNWGDPSTPAGLWWVVSGAIYRKLLFGVPLAYLPGRLASWGAEANRQLGGGPWGALLALLGLWHLERASRGWWWITAVTALAYTAYAVGYNAADSDVYLIPAWGMAALWLAQGIDGLAELIRRRAGRNWAVAGLLAITLGLPAVALVRGWPQMDLRRDHAAGDFVTAALGTAAPDAVILVGGDEPTFALWYARYGLGRRPDVAPVNVHLYDDGWYQAALLRYHPALAALTLDGDLPPLEQFVVEAAQRWPLYRAGSLGDVVTGLAETPQGVLVRLNVP